MAVAGASCPPLQKCVHGLTLLLNRQFLIFVIILAEFGFYVLIRQIVNAKEWLSACRLSSAVMDHRRILNFHVGTGRKGLLRLQLRGAKTYQVSLVPLQRVYLTCTGMERRGSHA